MILPTKPELKVFDRYKLQVSRRPGFMAWLILITSSASFIGISYRLIGNIFLLIVLLLGEITFCLDVLGEWEELILDKEKNKATISKFTWCDKLCLKTTDKLSTVMKLSDIRHVGVSMEMGLFILHREGKTISLNMQGLTREEMQNLRKSINYFLNVCRIEHLDRCSIDPFDRLLSISDTEEERAQNFPKRNPLLSSLREVPACGDTLSCDDVRHSFHRNLSSPNLGSEKRLDNGRRNNLRRGPYTENLPEFDHPYYTKQTCIGSHGR